MKAMSISPKQQTCTPRPDSQLLSHSRPRRASQVRLLLNQLSRRASDSAGIPRPLVLQIVFPPPPCTVVAVAVFVSGRDGSSGVALDSDKPSLLVVLQQPDVAGAGVGGEGSVCDPDVMLGQNLRYLVESFAESSM